MNDSVIEITKHIDFVTNESLLSTLDGGNSFRNVYSIEQKVSRICYFTCIILNYLLFACSSFSKFVFISYFLFVGKTVFFIFLNKIEKLFCMQDK